jgi:WXG100 family type VII secretion target
MPFKFGGGGPTVDIDKRRNTRKEVDAVTGPGFLLDTQAAAKAVQAYDVCSDNAQRTLQQMLGDVDALRATRYSGKQRQAFDAAVDGLDADLRKLVTLLSNLSAVVNSTQTGYSTTDETIAQDINSSVGDIYNRLSG